MTWDKAIARALLFAERRGVKYVVFGEKIGWRWRYYALPAGHAALAVRTREIQRYGR
jgi:hypothetical protein